MFASQDVDCSPARVGTEGRRLIVREGRIDHREVAVAHVQGAAFSVIPPLGTGQRGLGDSLRGRRLSVGEGDALKRQPVVVGLKVRAVEVQDLHGAPAVECDLVATVDDGVLARRHVQGSRDRDGDGGAAAIEGDDAALRDGRAQLAERAAGDDYGRQRLLPRLIIFSIGICLSKRSMNHFGIADNSGTISRMGPPSEMSYCDDL